MTLSNIVVPTITDHTIVAAYAGIMWTGIQDLSSLVNYLVGGALQVDKASAGWLDAAGSVEFENIDFRLLADQFRDGGIYFGGTDIKARVASGAITNFQIALIESEEDSMRIYGVSSVLEIILE